MKTSLVTAAIAITVIALASSLASCSIAIDPITGRPSLGTDPAAVAALADAVAEKINDRIEGTK